MNDQTARRIFSPMWRTVGRAVAAMAFAVLALCAQTSASAAEPNIGVSPSSAPPGGTVSISGNVALTGTPSCASDPAQLTSTADLFPPDGFGPQVTRDAAGNFQIGYVIPAATPAGSYSIGVRCGGGNVGISATLRVTERTTLANTGSSMVGQLFFVGVGLVVLGLLPFAGRERVRRTRQPPRT